MAYGSVRCRRELLSVVFRSSLVDNSSSGPTVTLLVRRSGPMLTVQDLGRRGRADHGIARSGAFDHVAAALANRLVGNAVGAAVLESLFGSCGFELADPAVVAVTGATLPLLVNRIPAPMNTAVALQRGDELALGMPTEGLRAYVAIRGGVDVPVVLGSRSFDSLGKIGPAPIVDGARLDAGSMAMGDAWFSTVPVRPRDGLPTIEIVIGPRHDWLSRSSQITVASETWTVQPESDRTGVRLSGTALVREESVLGRELPSEAMIPGAVQVPPNGQPIILGPDCGTTGGYPVVAVVRERSMAVIAQLRPGQLVRFRYR